MSLAKQQGSDGNRRVKNEVPNCTPSACASLYICFPEAMCGPHNYGFAQKASVSIIRLGWTLDHSNRLSRFAHKLINQTIQCSYSKFLRCSSFPFDHEILPDGLRKSSSRLQSCPHSILIYPTECKLTSCVQSYWSRFGFEAYWCTYFYS